MKSAFATVVGFSLIAASAAFADPVPSVQEGAALYEARCKMCHATGMGGAPLIDQMAELTPDVVVEKITNGTMAPMASGISPENKRDIAVFLTKKPLPAQDGMPAVEP